MTNKEKLAFIENAHELEMRFELLFKQNKTPRELLSLIEESRLEFSKKLLPKIPKTLYRYRSFRQTAIDELKNGYAWFSHPKDFDDGTDAALNYDIEGEMEDYRKSPDKYILSMAKGWLSQRFRELYGNDPDPRIMEEAVNAWNKGELNSLTAREIIARHDPYTNSTLLIHMLKTFGEEVSRETIMETIELDFKNYSTLNNIIRKNIYCLCLAEDYSNNAMWATYANDSKGFCIEYTFDWETPLARQVLKALKPIYYGDRKPMQLLGLSIAGLNAPENDRNGPLLKNACKDMDVSKLTKSEEWAFQKEWRVVYNPRAAQNLQRFPFVSSIILGDKMPKRNKQVLIKMATRNGWTVLERKLSSSGSGYNYVPLINHASQAK